MYTEIGSFEAKAQLSKLLHAVQKGQRYTITLRGRPIANLVPAEPLDHLEPLAAVEAMRHMNKVSDVQPREILQWTAEGRK